MAVTVLKASFNKAPPKEMLHRDYESFEHELNTIELIQYYCEFEKVLVDILKMNTLL